MKKSVFIITIVSLLYAGHKVLAADTDGSKWILRLGVPINFNSTGTALLTDINRRYKIYDSGSRVLNDNFIDFGYKINIAPELLTGPIIRIQPGAFLTVMSGIYYLAGKEKSFNSFSDTSEKSSGFGHGYSYNVLATLKFKYSHLLLIDRLEFYYVNSNYSELFYNWYHDHIQKNGMNFENSAMALWEFYKNVYMGAFFLSTHIKENNQINKLAGFTFMAPSFKLLSDNDYLIIQVGKWISNPLRENNYGGIRVSVFYGMDFSL